ncbi:hypothetical protein BC830DRAFT_1068444 [Chytriomyces sp. MP71]|nr:hypothetical protein BC830DRAFT_1068444 [Chytriomyces sp. MP71]
MPSSKSECFGLIYYTLYLTVSICRLESKILNETALCGVKGIGKAFISDYKVSASQFFCFRIDPTHFRRHQYKGLDADGKYITQQHYFLETNGSNFKDVLCLEGVNSSITTSNSIVEVYDVLGIEATRAALLNELRGVINSDGSYVNYRHLALLSDVMCQNGKIMPITRHGINRTDAGVLARCSFEETVELLFESAGHGELDDCKGVSENVILGQLAQIGTGSFDVLLNEEMLQNAQEMHDPMQQGFANQYDYMGGQTPYINRDGSMTPMHDINQPYSPNGQVIFSPSHSQFTPAHNGGSAYSPGPTSPIYSPSS